MGSSVLDSKRQSLSDTYRDEFHALRTERQVREGILGLAQKARTTAEPGAGELSAVVRERFAAQAVIGAMRRELDAAQRLIQELEGEIDGSAERAA